MLSVLYKKNTNSILLDFSYFQNKHPRLSNIFFLKELQLTCNSRGPKRQWLLGSAEALTAGGVLQQDCMLTGSPATIGSLRGKRGWFSLFQTAHSHENYLSLWEQYRFILRSGPTIIWPFLWVSNASRHHSSRVDFQWILEKCIPYWSFIIISKITL